MKPLRVLAVVTNFGRHGANVILQRFLQGLDRSRIDLELCTIAGTGSEYEAVRSLGFPIHLHQRASKFDPQLTWKLRSLMRKGRYDLVYTTKHSSAFLARPAARWAGIPLLVHERGSPLQFVPPLVRLADRYQSRGNHLVVANSLHTQEVASRVLGIDPKRIRVIYNPVPDLKPPPAREPRSGGSPHLGYFGRLTPAKGVDLMLRSLKLLQPEFPDLRATITGEGPSREDLEELSRDLKLGTCVRFQPWQSDVLSAMESVDMVIVPSLFEPFGNVVAEAALAQTPVVAARVGGIPEILERTGHGVTVDPSMSLNNSGGDAPFAAKDRKLKGARLLAVHPQALAESVTALWKDTSARNEMCGTSFARVSQAFPLNRYVESMMEAMDEASAQGA